MNWWWRRLLHGKRIDKQMRAELQFHLERQVADNLRAGMTEQEARRSAALQFGGEEQIREACRDARGTRWAETILQDLRFAVRTLRKSPGFALAAVCTLALGIGANSAIFSLVDTVLLKLLPVKTPEQLYLIGHKTQHVTMTWNYPDYRAMRDRNTVFSGLAGYSMGLQSIGVQSGDAAEKAAELSYGIFVSGNYFEVLGVSPLLGRFFQAADDRAPGAAPYVILSYAYWHSHLSEDRGVIGRKLRLNGYPLTVIGVAPRGFTGADTAFKPDLFIPIMMQSELRHVSFASWNDRHSWWMAALGRLKPDASLKKAESELFAICKDQESAESRTLSNPQWADRADPIVLTPAARGFSYLLEQIKKPLLILFCIVGVVLCIACANVANLMLARGAARQREIAVRLAVGASRWRVISQLLTESLLIALLGGASGVLVALAATPLLLRFMPHPGYNLTSIDAHLDGRVLAFTLAACVVTGLLFGIAPAWQSTRPQLVPSLKEDIRGSTGAGRFTLRKALVILQVALSLPLLVGAGLFARTLGNLRGLDTGFVPENVSIASVDPTSFGYKGQRTKDFYDRLCARVAALPGVRSASLALITPLTGSSWNNSISVEGYTPKPAEDSEVWFNAVGARYFATMGTPVLLGRDFAERDNPLTAIQLPDRLIPGQALPDAPGSHVAIVNEGFARHYFGDRSAIGMHVAMAAGKVARVDGKSYEIVGVVKNARYFDMRNSGEPMMFIPVWRRYAAQRELIIRTAGSAAPLAGELRREIGALDPVIPLLNLRTLEHDVDENILVERLVAALSEFFGILALLLSAVGLYGVVAYTVTRRTREIGIRMAVGASRPSVLWLVIRDVLAMVLLGGLIGSVAALLGARVIAGLLYGVGAIDPLSVIAAGLTVIAAALLASYLPARRAARIDPMQALRSE